MLVMVIMARMSLGVGPICGAIDRFEQPACIHRAMVRDDERRGGIKFG